MITESEIFIEVRVSPYISKRFDGTLVPLTWFFQIFNEGDESGVRPKRSIFMSPLRSAGRGCGAAEDGRETEPGSVFSIRGWIMNVR